MFTAGKMKFSSRKSLITEKILNRKLHSFCTVIFRKHFLQCCFDYWFLSFGFVVAVITFFFFMCNSIKLVSFLFILLSTAFKLL